MSDTLSSIILKQVMECDNRSRVGPDVFSPYSQCSILDLSDDILMIEKKKEIYSHVSPTINRQQTSKKEVRV